MLNRVANSSRNTFANRQFLVEERHGSRWTRSRL